VTGGAVAVVVAAGAGERLGAGVPKALVELAGRSLVARAVAAAASCRGVETVVVAVPPGAEERLRARLGSSTILVPGGPSRHASVAAALAAVPPGTQIVVVHDAARPFATPSLFSAVIQALDGADAAIPVLPLADTVKRVRDGWVVATESRDELAAAQTPQAFRAGALLESHARAAAERLEFTDDAAAVEWAGFRVRAVPGEPGNFKVTTAEDLARAFRVVEAAGG
jgi:2-C-methyl-D-erythritol 4-phosphate cytidylyltransferase